MKKIREIPRNSLIIVILLIGTILLPFGTFVQNAIAPTYLTLKWPRYSLGSTASGVLIANVRNDIAGEEVIVVGSGWARCLRGSSGATIWEQSLPNVWYWSQPQMADLDQDGDFEILIPYGDWPSGGNGLYVLNGNDGSRFWPDSQTQGKLGGTSIVSSPVIGDINGDGYPEIFVVTEDITHGLAGTGRITSLSHTGGVLNQAFIWRPCAGGLSLVDGDHDDIYELYMGDRDMYMEDGGWGKGVRSFWADNLTVRWNHPDILCSSQAPPLADVNGDGILDVIVSNQRGGVIVLDSRTGSAIRKDRNLGLGTHYQGSVYDIDGDGHLEFLVADGDHGNTADDCAVFDLVDWEVDGRFDVGLCHYGPQVADVTGDGEMDIVACSYLGVHIVDSSTYTVVDEQFIPGIPWYDNKTGEGGNKFNYAVVQDIDGDGLVEIVISSHNGEVRAYDTPAPAPSRRARSEVQFFSERRLGVAEDVPAPGEEPAPMITSPYPSDRAENVPTSLSQLRFTLRDYQVDQMDYTVTSSPYIGSRTGINVPSGTEITVSVPGPLSAYTEYSWTVTVTDGTYTTTRTFKFRTAFATTSNLPPTHDTPLLTGGTTSGDNLVCYNQTTSDPNGNKVTNTYNWYINDVRYSNLVLPFNTRGATSSNDYSGYGNNAVIKGATWASNGKVGACYEFTGDDYVMVPHSATLGGDGTWTEITVELWIYLSANQYGTRPIAKIPSYEIRFSDSSSNRIYAGVWTDDDYESTSNYRLSLNTWYHIAMTYKDGEGITLYVNGVAQAFEAHQGAIKASAGSRSETREPLYIGWFDFFRGRIDEVRIYPRALSPEQINQRYMETRDGTSSSSTLTAYETRRGDTVRCMVTPSDGIADGLGKYSNTVGPLQNGPPVATNLQMYPQRSRGNYALTTESLGATYDYWDVDGDMESGTEIRWYKNGGVQSAYNNLKQVPSSATAAGESWYFTVRPRDGITFGTLETSVTTVIVENDPPTHDTPLLISSHGQERSDEELICRNQTTTDSDGDNVTNIYNWYLDDTSFTNLLLPFDTDSLTQAKDYSGYSNDGVVSGATWIDEGVIGGAYHFDGNDIITIEDDDTLGGIGTWTQMSLEFWIKPSVPLHGTRIIARKIMTASTGSFMVGFQTSTSDPDNTLFWGITPVGDSFVDTSGVDNWADVRDKVALTTGEWHHVFCTYQSGLGLTIYVGGIEKLNMPLTGNIDYEAEEKLFIGSSGEEASNRWLNGSLDEIRLYPAALSPAQIFQRYLETKDGHTSSTTIVPQQTQTGDDWKCEVIPNDSWQDGTTKVSNTITVKNTPGNSRPRIDIFVPADTTLAVNVADTLNFTQVSSDPDGDTLTHSWLLNSIQQAITQNWTYSPSSSDVGTRNVTLVVSDPGGLLDSQQWEVQVTSGSAGVAYIVVRGLDSQIYYRLYNSSTDDWGSWKTVPTGATGDSPAAAACSGRLNLVVRGMDGSTIWFASINLADESFSGWTPIPGATSSAPTLVADDSELILVVRGLDNRIYYCRYNCPSGPWGAWKTLPTGATNDRPAAEILENELHLVVRGMDGSTIWFASINLADESFSGWTPMPGATPSALALAASEAENSIYLTARGLDNHIYLNLWNGASWEGWTALPDGATDDSPAAVVLGDELHIIVRSGTILWHCWENLTTSTHSGWAAMSGATSSSPTSTG